MIRQQYLPICVALLLVSGALATATARTNDAADWDTYYEKSGKTRTPRYAETIDFCRRLDEASPWVRYTTFGVSPQGRDLPLLIVSKRGVFSPEEAERARRKGHIIILVQAGIHAGEIEGKDAALMLVRDIAVMKRFPELLDDVSILFIPIFNVDGHERFGPYNRINQNGPEEMGWRTTANSLNLNRDYLKADAEETRAWLQLFNAWLPDFFVDCHTTDGADYQYVVTYIVDIFGNMAPALTDWARDVYIPRMEKTMAAAGFPLSPYVLLREWPDPRSGMISWVSSPRFSQGYTSLQNRPGVLIETHMLKEYSVRVDATYEMLKQSIELIGREKEGLRKAIIDADAFSASPEFRQEPYPLRFRVDTAESLMIDFRGVSYESVESDLSGGTLYRFSNRPETFQVPYFSKQRILATADLPEAYIVPAEWKDVIDRLVVHGIELERLSGPIAIDVHSWRFTNPQWQQNPYEGRHPLNFDLEPLVERRTFPAGSAVIDMNQRRSRVAAHILEPEGPDSYVQWGFFDAVFEQKEYADSYVLEKIAREMLEESDTLRSEFEAEKAADPDFAKDPRRILRWFYQRTPWWDDRKDVYPVGKIFDRRVADALLANRSAPVPMPDAADRVRIAEARRVLERCGDNLWTGFTGAPGAVLLVSRQNEYLFYHPSPTNDFVFAGYDSITRSDVYARDRVFATNLLATFPAVSGVPTVVIGQPRHTDASHTTRWVATLLHEHFHQLQTSRPDYYGAVAALGLAGDDTTGMWMLDYPFPYDSKEVNRAFSAMCRRLYDALEAVGKASFHEKVAGYLEARRSLGEMLEAKDYAYFSFQVWQEGIARYTEYALMRRAAVAYTPTKAFEELRDRVSFDRDAEETYDHILSGLLRASLKSARRTAFYHVGAAEGILLDQVNPGWRQRYFSEPFRVDRYFEAGGRLR